MAHGNDIRGSGGAREYGNASLGGFLVTAAIFMLVLTLGYFNYAQLIWPDAPALVQVLIGATIAFGALVLSRATAAARLSRAGAPQTWLVFFALLLGISSLGTMNALFYFFEGDQVADQRVEQARGQLAQLKTSGDLALATPAEYDKLRADVRGLLGELSDRIFSVGSRNSCGIGQNARVVINKIGEKLSGFDLIPHTPGMHDCAQQADLKRIYEQYEQRADLLLQVVPIYRDLHIAERDMARKTLDSSIDGSMQELSAALSVASGTSQGVARSYRPLQIALLNAADTYRQQLAAVRSAVGMPFKFEGGMSPPESLDIEDVMQLGNIAFILKNIILRLDRIQTYFYLLGAIALDACMVWAFATLMREISADPARRDSLVAPEDAEVRVHYLWNSGTN